MTAIEISPGVWVVAVVVATGFESNAAAWRWIDRATGDDRRDTDYVNRMRAELQGRE
jgi:hypothetical protein